MAFKLRRDSVYLGFLLIHFFATILIDSQALWFSSSISPNWIRSIFLLVSKDEPLLSSSTLPEFAWFQSFLCFEMIVQLPLNAFCLVGLWKESASYYPILAIYSMSCIPTTLACIVTLFSMPGIESQLPQLMSTYLPFLIIPSIMCFDYISRLSKILNTIPLQKKLN